VNAPDPSLVLRDIHQPAPPPWWPPAPGWWLLAGALALCVAAYAWVALRRRRRLRALAAGFDADIAAAPTPVARVAAASAWLRRAARARDPAAATLHGEAWLAFVGASPGGPPFAALLLEGAFRPEVGAAEADALVAEARRRILAWGAAR
jgi:hypothetical protein